MKEKGELYKDVAKDALWKEVDKALLKLKRGEIADYLIESQTGYHIVKLIDKNGDKFSFRQIIDTKKFEEPGEKRFICQTAKNYPINCSF